MVRPAQSFPPLAPYPSLHVYPVANPYNAYCTPFVYSPPYSRGRTPPYENCTPTCGCLPRIGASTLSGKSLMPPLFLGILVSRKWLPGGLTQINLPCSSHFATQSYMCNPHVCIHGVLHHPKIMYFAPMVRRFRNTCDCSYPPCLLPCRLAHFSKGLAPSMAHNGTPLGATSSHFLQQRDP